MTIDWMSDGLMRFSGLRGSDGEPPMPIPADSVSTLLIGTPSITYSGSLLALIEVPPRMRNCAPDPGSPLFCVIWTPATRPSIISLTFVITPTSASSASTSATEPVMASRRWLPYPVTTISVRTVARVCSEKSAVVVAPAVTVTDRV